MNKLAISFIFLLSSVLPCHSAFGNEQSAEFIVEKSIETRIEGVEREKSLRLVDVNSRGQNELSLSLYEAITLAIAKNYQVRISRIELDIADDEVKRSNGFYDPTISASHSRESRHNGTLASDLTPLEREDNWLTTTQLGGIFPWGTRYNLQLSYAENGQISQAASQTKRGRFHTEVEISQPLLNGLITNEYSIDQKISKANAKLQRQSLKEELMRTVRQVVLVYTDLYFAEKNLGAALLTEKRAQKLVNDNQDRAKIGRSAKSDIVVARARLARRYDNVIAAKRLLEVQKNNLALIISDPDVDAKRLISIKDLPRPRSFERDVNSDKKFAAEQRADYQKALVNIEQSELILKRDSQRLLPKLDLTVRYGQEGLSNTGGFSSTLDGYDEDNRHNLYTGLTVSMPLSNKTARAQRSISRRRHHIAKLQEKFLRRNLETRIDNAYTSVLTSLERLENSRESLSLAELSLTYEEKKLQVDRSNSFFVLNLQDELASVRIRSIVAKTDYFKAVVNYHYEIGDILNYFDLRVSY